MKPRVVTELRRRDFGGNVTGTVPAVEMSLHVDVGPVHATGVARAVAEHACRSAIVSALRALADDVERGRVEAVFVDDVAGEERTG